MYQQIIILFVDNKVVLLSTVCKYYFLSSHFVFETRYMCMQRDWKDTISGVYVSPGSAETLVERGEIKSPFDSILSQQHLCQKLPKSVDVRRSYSVLHARRFLDTVYITEIYASVSMPVDHGRGRNAQRCGPRTFMVDTARRAARGGRAFSSPGKASAIYILGLYIERPPERSNTINQVQSIRLPVVDS